MLCTANGFALRIFFCFAVLSCANYAGLFFPLFLANGAVYLSELKSEASISCQQDRISNKYVNNASLSRGCGRCSHVACPGHAVWGSGGLGEDERFSSICESERNKIKSNLRGQRNKGEVVRKVICPCHYRDRSFSLVWR